MFNQLQRQVKRKGTPFIMFTKFAIIGTFVTCILFGGLFAVMSVLDKIIERNLLTMF